MSGSEFLRHAKDRAPSDLSAEAIEKAFRIGEEWSPQSVYYENQVGRLLTCARLLSPSHGPQPSGQEVATETIDIPGVTLRRDEILDRIDGDVGKLREVIFRSRAVPFATYGDARQWIRQAALDQSPPSPADQKRLSELISEIWEKIEAVSALNVWTQLAVLTGQLAILDPDTGQRVKITSHSPLAHLSLEIQRLAQDTGFREEDLIAYVLAGVEPRLSPATVEIRQREHPEVLVTLRTSALRFEELRGLFRTIQKSWPVSEKKWDRITDADLVVRAVVSDLGGPPDPVYQKNFWQAVRNECDERGLHYESWRSPMMRWKRLKAKLNPVEQ